MTDREDAGIAAVLLLNQHVQKPRGERLVMEELGALSCGWARLVTGKATGAHVVALLEEEVLPTHAASGSLL